MSDDGALLRLEVPDRREALAAARKALTALNGSLHLVSEVRLRDAQLLLSELVANAVRYGDGTPVSLSVRAEPDILRVEVSDRGAGFDPLALAAPSTRRSGGWGLPIVAALSHRWGVDYAPSGTTVWFRNERPGGEMPLPIHTVPPS